MSVNAAAPSPPKRPESIGGLLFRAARGFDADLNRGLRARGYLDVRVAHAAVFARLDPTGTRVVDLAERAGMTKQSMAELIDDLVEKGYLERQPDPTDRRAKLIVATARGRRLLGDAAAEIGRIEDAYRALVGEDQLNALRSMLAAIAEATAGA